MSDPCSPGTEMELREQCPHRGRGAGDRPHPDTAHFNGTSGRGARPITLRSARLCAHVEPQSFPRRCGPGAPGVTTTRTTVPLLRALLRTGLHAHVVIPLLSP